MRRAGERGSAAVWVVAVAALLLVIAAAGTLRGLAVLARHRAEAAADLAALAGAAQVGTAGSPCGVAARTAAANGGSVRSCRVEPDPGGRSGQVHLTVLLRVHLPVVGTRTVTANAVAARLPG